MTELIQELELKRDDVIIKMEEYKRKRDEIDRLANSWADKRDELNKKVKFLREQAREQRNKVIRLNEEINKLKLEAQALRKESKKFSEKLAALMRYWLPKKGPRLGELREELKKLEFRQQTQVLTHEREKELVDRLGKIKTQIEEREKVLEQNEDIRKTLSTLDEIKNGLRERRKKILELVKEAREARKLINNLYRQADELRNKADEAQKQFIEFRQASAQEHKEYLALLSQVRDFDKVLSGLRQKEGIAVRAKIDSKLKEEAQKIYKRFKQGEKLSTEDLMTLQKAGLL